jgi:hypothetical protein
VLRAWRELRRIQHDQAHRNELPIAALQALTANINRDTKSRPKAFTAAEFVIFRRSDTDDTLLPGPVAATALALRAEHKDSPILLAAWDQVLASADDTSRPPAVRALHSDDKQVWVLCPEWEGPNIRGGLVAVGDNLHGPTRLRDVDRPLSTYTVILPDRRTFAWLEAGLLLPTREN